MKALIYGRFRSAAVVRRAQPPALPMPRLLFLSCGFLVLLPSWAPADPPTRDLSIATLPSRELKLDLFFPHNVTDTPLVVFIHGGGWEAGNYKNQEAVWLTDHGFAVANISYRMSYEAVFPAQIHDCKAAIRWLRAHAGEYGYDATRVGVIGTSAGGHLAMLLGVTGGNQFLEGEVGGHLDQSSRVQAVVDLFGASDFVYRSRNQPSKTEDPQGPVYKLLGGAVTQNLAKAKRASPICHLTADDPPLLIVHGEKDDTVFPDQARRMNEAYKKACLDVSLVMLPDAGHGGSGFSEESVRQAIAELPWQAFENEQVIGRCESSRTTRQQEADDANRI